MYSRAGAYPANQPMLYAEDFSPNTPQGACPACHGQNLRDILVTLGYDVDRPWKDLPKKDREWILFTDETPTVPVYAGFTPAETRAALKRKREPSYMGTFTGARRYVLHTFANTQSALMRKRVSRYMEGRSCPSCHGKRLKSEALSVTFAGVDIGEFMQMPLDRLAALLEPISAGDFRVHTAGAETGRDATRRDRAERAAAGHAVHATLPDVRRTSALSEEKRIAAQRLAGGVMARLRQLRGLGLGYLTLDRATPTLSAGELQRLRLATQLSSMLFGVVYVLDEPSAGLHPADSQALYDSLDKLRDAGNSVFVVEHELDLMRRAQWLVAKQPSQAFVTPQQLGELALFLCSPAAQPGTLMAAGWGSEALRAGGNLARQRLVAFGDEGHRRGAVGIELENALGPALLVEEHLAETGTVPQAFAGAAALGDQRGDAHAPALGQPVER